MTWAARAEGWPHDRAIVEEAVGGDPVDKYIMDVGGQPVRALVTTTWRSGSTFLGDILLSHPGTFYHYEPLLHYDIVQARSGALADDAVRTLKDLMHCNYTNLGEMKPIILKNDLYNIL